MRLAHLSFKIIFGTQNHNHSTVIPSLQTHLIVYLHGVDALQFAGPVLRLVVGDVWTGVKSKRNQRSNLKEKKKG